VLLLNNATWDYWSGDHWKERIAGRLPNVEHRTIDAEHIDVPDHSQDVVLLIKAYHDFYAQDRPLRAGVPQGQMISSATGT
jgi:hypothetical protein